MSKRYTGRFDGVWKGMIEDHLPQFLAFHLGENVSDYDFSTAEHLDKELEI